MSIPLQILGRSFRLIAAQPIQTVKVIAPGVVISALGAGFLLQGIGASDDFDGINNLPLFLLGLLFIVAGWMTFAIFWHRHALLQDAARADVMRPGQGVFRRYFNAAARVALIFCGTVLCGALGFGIVTSVLTAVLGGATHAVLFFSLMIGLTVFLTWVLLRVSLILPAAATGQSMKVAESWQATGVLSHDIMWTAVLLGVLNVTLEQVVGGLSLALPGLALILGIMQILAQSLIYISVLSTLYGHLIERRPLI